MSWAGRGKALLNAGLRPWNVRIESLAADKAEKSRLLSLEVRGQYAQPVFPLLEAFRACDPEITLRSVRKHSSDTARFAAKAPAGGFTFDNSYFTSPDAEVAYALARELRPRRIVEIGSGNSTLLFRRAILDGGLNSELVAIDPSPRENVQGVADRVIEKRLEEVDEAEVIGSLDLDDILFIDSSHRIEAGNDVVTLLLRIVPELKSGVVVHLHDIFLPFEYPREWLVDFGWRWNEQYLVQALLQDSVSMEVLWPGHYLERTLPNFRASFPVMKNGHASSLWIRKLG